MPVNPSLGFRFAPSLARSSQALWRLVAPIALVLLLSGCLTIRRGSTQIVPVDSDPQGATVEIQPGGRIFETPEQVVLARRYSQTLRFSKEGYQPQTILIDRKTSSGLFRNVIWIHPVGWIIGVVVDLSTGSAYDLEPGHVFVELTPAPLTTESGLSGS
jgi:hypothetical protein